MPKGMGYPGGKGKSKRKAGGRKMSGGGSSRKGSGSGVSRKQPGRKVKT